MSSFWKFISKAAPLLDFGGSIASSLITNAGQKKREAETRKHNIELWKMQNQYNLPINQMQRLEDAGLNPNLVYGGSPGQVSGQAGAVSPGKAPQFQFSNPINNIATTTLLDAQRRNVNANTLKQEEDTANTKLQNWLLDKAKDSQLAIQVHKAEQERQVALQQGYNTLELSKSFQKRVDILGEMVRQNKSQTAIKELDAMFAKEAKLRPNDPFYARVLKNIWDMATNFKDPNWLSKKSYDYFKKGQNIKNNNKPDN